MRILSPILLSSLFISGTLLGNIDISEPIIGIDLGTTYSCVGIYKNGRVEIIANEFGRRITPSQVAFTDQENLVGEAALNQGGENIQRTISVVKRLVGKKFEDPEVQQDMKYLPYRVVKGTNGKAMISITNDSGKTKLISPEEVSALILGKMKEIAEKYIGQIVKYAVITVPAYFNDGQRKATMDAGKIAGLEVLRIINEPTAAALGFSLNKMQGQQNIIVYDLGGGTFDVSLLTISNGDVRVRSKSGDTHLGGEDFDQILCDYFIKNYLKKTNRNIRENPRALQKLKTAVEKAKRDLSTNIRTKISVENLIEGEDFQDSITRGKFEELCGYLFKKTIQPVQEVLDQAKMEKSDIHDIILVGGSTRIPKIQELIRNFFDGKIEPKNRINPDEAVAQGAAVQGGMLKEDKSGNAGKINLIDVTPISFGTDIIGEKMSIIIPKGTIIPTKMSRKYTTVSDYQQHMTIKVFEGEHPMIYENKLLGQFDLNGIQRAVKGIPSIEVSFEIDNNNMLSATALEVGTGNIVMVIIKRDNGDLDVDEIIKEASIYNNNNQKFKGKNDAKTQFEQYIERIKDAISNSEKLAKKLELQEKFLVRNIISSAEDWLIDNENKSSKDEVEEKLKSTMKVCDSILEKYYKQHGKIKYQEDYIEDL